MSADPLFGVVGIQSGPRLPERPVSCHAGIDLLPRAEAALRDSTQLLLQRIADIVDADDAIARVRYNDRHRVVCIWRFFKVTCPIFFVRHTASATFNLRRAYPWQLFFRHVPWQVALGQQWRSRLQPDETRATEAT